ncbi:MAG: Nif3-like dinuclear metal center hexameric protein [Candidatus Hodarchaeales archaeon]
MPIQFNSKADEKTDIQLPKVVPSDDVTNFLEQISPTFEFERVGYEIRTVDHINGIYLTVNPDPRNLEFIPPHSLVLSHHKISVYKNLVYNQIISNAKNKKINIYNYHLAWDIMDDGIADSFLQNLGFSKDRIRKVALTYKNQFIPRLGSIIRGSVSIKEIISRLNKLKAYSPKIINPQNNNQIIGYIPGGGFVDTMICEMANEGVEVLISSDPNWVVEIMARELGMTFISIDHYLSESYGLPGMRQVLSNQFPQIPIIICENIETVQLDDLLQDLVNIAYKDGVLTDEEDRLIQIVNIEIEKFKKYYKQAWEDGLIIPEEKHELEMLWKRIYSQSFNLIKKDQKNSPDKTVLLSRIFKTINHSISTIALDGS